MEEYGRELYHNWQLAKCNQQLHTYHLLAVRTKQSINLPITCIQCNPSICLPPAYNAFNQPMVRKTASKISY